MSWPLRLPTHRVSTCDARGLSHCSRGKRLDSHVVTDRTIDIAACGVTMATGVDVRGDLMKRSLRGRTRARALPLGFLAAAAATFLAISPVMADTTLKHHGKIGAG